jgi:hypothetical protein
MSKGMIGTLLYLLLLLATAPVAVAASGEIYKVVDKDGNVTYTDQRPSSDAQPVDLPELSVVETDIQVPEAGQPDASAEAEAKSLTPRELRRQFADFRIIQPEQEETFWGTANSVVVSWGSAQSAPPELSARLFVDGAPQEVPVSGSVTLTLDRGEHQVYAELLDARKRRIVTTDTVTFFVKQHSVNFNQPVLRPQGGGR